MDDDKKYEIIISKFQFINKSGEILQEFVSLTDENFEWYTEQGFKYHEVRTQEIEFNDGEIIVAIEIDQD